MRVEQRALLAVLTLAVLLLGSTILTSSLVVDQGGASAGGGLASVPAADIWSLASLSATPLQGVPDSEPGIDLPGAVDHGPASVPLIPILVAFPPTHSAELSVFLAELSTPRSSLYHHYLTQAEFDAEYGGTRGPYQSAVQYFTSFGVSNVTTGADHLVITFQATPAQVDAIFHTRIDTFSSGARSYYAPVAPVELPSPIAAAISTVEGLCSYSEYLNHPLGQLASPAFRPPPKGSSAPSSPAAGYLPPASVGGVQYEFAPDFQVAYDELSLFANAGYPTNMVVATILWSGCTSTTSPCPSGDGTAPFYPTDISDFYNETLPAGQPHPSVYGVNYNGAPPPGPSAQYDQSGAVGENTLDLEMVGSTAPGASIYNVYGASPSGTNLDGAFSYILNPTNTPGLSNVSVISNSWGGSDGNDSVWYTDLQEAQARGVSVLASSGDSGANPASSKWAGSYAAFPASMAYNDFGTVAVGGTTVTLNADSSSSGYLDLTGQLAWYISAADVNDGGPAGSSGGVSTVFPEPSWQASTSANAVIRAAGQGAGRGVPDISAIANNTLVTITVGGYQYQATYALTGGGYFDSSWGTSVASPIEAGIAAEIDHVLLAHSNPELGFLDPQLYSLADAQTAPLVNSTETGYSCTTSPCAYASALPTVALLDIESGANHLYAATRGYDLVTGWGSIDAYNYTMYFLTVPSTGVYGRLSGIEDSLTLNGLSVYSTGPQASYNASIQQNFFLANSLGAPVYWVQNVIYILWEHGQWAMWDTGWVIYPFYGLYYQLSLYEYNFPTGSFVGLPSTFDVKTALLTPSGFNTQYVSFSVGPYTVRLPVPGAAYIIGSLSYNYSWQGVNYTNGPFPGNPNPGGLAPQFGLVGGPSGGTGEFGSPTSGGLSANVLPYGTSTYIAAATRSFGENIDQTGEIAANLQWSQQSSNQWALGISPGSTVQGVLAYQPTGLSSYAVSFGETGLPSGMPWSITLNGATQSSTSSTIAFSEPNGTYSYTVGTVSGYASIPSVGSVTVNGAPVGLPIAFTVAPPSTFPVTFAEGGLPSGTTWWVNLTGGGSFASSTTALTFNETNGTYVYGLGSADKIYAASGGTFRVNGAAVSESVTFSPVTFSVTFTESGLPAGTTWWVNLTGGGSFTSSTTTIGLSEANGTYVYGVASANKIYSASDGTFRVNGAAISEPVPFSAVMYAVTFAESGLTGATWGITVNGTLETAAAPSSITFQEPNGTFIYHVSNVAGWRATAYAGTFTEQGGVQNPNPVYVVFAPVTYTVSFAETGLPSGTNWSVTLGSSTLTASTSTVTLTEPNGTYSYTIGDLPGWHQTTLAYRGSVTVDGASVDEPTLVFTQTTYTVTFTETGLANGTQWTVQATMTAPGPSWFVNSSSPTASLQLPNGTYTFTISAVGYGTVTETGQTVSGTSSTLVPVALTPTSSPAFPWVYVIAGAVAATVIVLTIVVLLRRGKGGSASGG